MKASELILNSDGSLYHLGLKPGDCAPLILTVGDPERVSMVSQYFDKISFTHQTREICTHTGTISGKQLTVMSTGMGTDNIDIVFNELDALFNIDLSTGNPLPTHTPLTFIRLGTSGAVQENIDLNTIISAETAIGFDNLLHHYQNTNHPMATALTEYLSLPESFNHPYAYDADKSLLSVSNDLGFVKGVIATHAGFYGPQMRSLRLQPQQFYSFKHLNKFRHDERAITHFDMESAGIYGLSSLLGHRALSVSAVLANRALGTFSSKPNIAVEKMIERVLEAVSSGKFC